MARLLGVLVLTLALGAQPAAAEPARTVDTTFHVRPEWAIPGLRLADPELDQKWRGQPTRVQIALSRELALDVGAVPVHVMTSHELVALHRAIGGRLGYRRELNGVEFKGHVFVTTGLVLVPDEVLIHELIHAASPRFSDEASARGYSLVVEGITQHFTVRVLRAQLGVRRKNKIYVNGTDFADSLAELVGEERLAEHFFHGRYSELEREVDAKLGRGHMHQAIVALAREGFLAAQAILSPTTR